MKENNKIKYKFDKKYLILNPGTNNKMKFKNNKDNIIDKFTYIETKSKKNRKNQYILN